MTEQTKTFSFEVTRKKYRERALITNGKKKGVNKERNKSVRYFNMRGKGRGFLPIKIRDVP